VCHKRIYGDTEWKGSGERRRELHSKGEKEERRTRRMRRTRGRVRGEDAFANTPTPPTYYICPAY
jgi:hypothetical protein